MTAVAPSTVVRRVRIITGQPGDQMCCLASEVMPIIERKIALYDAEYRNMAGHVQAQSGGIEQVIHQWSASSGRTVDACARRLWAYRNGETTCMTLDMADTLLLAVEEYIEDHTFNEFPGGKVAAEEQAELYSPDRSAEGKRKYAEAQMRRTWSILQAEYDRIGKPITPRRVKVKA